jgi:hypothetical protein
MTGPCRRHRDARPSEWHAVDADDRWPVAGPHTAASRPDTT